MTAQSKTRFKVADVSNVFSNDIAIDLGTANTLVYVKGQGVILDEPSLVAINTRAGRREILAVGATARDMIGRAPDNIDVIRPMRDGVIADFVATEEMLRQFIGKTKKMLGFFKPRILVCVPAGATPVERRAVFESAKSAGAGKVYLIDEPVAAALGIGLDIDVSIGTMVVDIGGGTSDIAVLSYGNVVQARSIKCAGDAMDEAIIRYVRRQHSLAIGEESAERIKIEAGSVGDNPERAELEVHISGKDLSTGQLKEVVLGSRDIGEALGPVVDMIADFIQRSLEDLPAGISTAICAGGIHLSGGGGQLDGLSEVLGQRVGVHFSLPARPTLAVVRGGAIVLDDLRFRRRLLIAP